MTPIEFLRAVWLDEGLYCIATPFPQKGYDHHVFETIEAAAAFVDSIGDTKNVFFATHTLKEERVWDHHHHRDADKEDKPWVGGWRVRTQLNMRSSRIFFFDLDVEADNDKKYSNQADAVAGLQSFVSATRLPIPMVVSSGGGLHVYWTLDRDLGSDEWAARAAKFKSLAHHLGLKIDNTRTTDTASVLRVAGTWNLKKTEKRPVVVYKQTTPITIEALDKLLDKAIDDNDIVVKARAAAKAAPSTFAAALGSNTQQTFDRPLPTMVSLLTACAQMRRIAAVEGATSNEPEWYAVAGALNYVQNGRKHFHHISRGHRDYDPVTCDAKFDQWKDKMSGAVSCSKMEDSCGQANAHLCHTCPFIKRAKFPTEAARLEEKAPPPVVAEVVAGVITEREIADPPLPWKRSREGGIVLILESKEGRAYERKIYPYDLYPLERSTSTAREIESQQWRAHLPHGATRDISIDAATFVDDKQLQTRLANHGIYTSNFGELKSYMSAYIQELIRLSPTAVQHTHLGWVDDNTKFVLPSKIILPDGSDSSVQLSKVAATSRNYLTQKGTLQRQVELMSFYNDRRYVKHQLFILASLASPLFWMTGHNGVIIHAQGETGASKSSALYTAAAIWGNPKKSAINCTAKGATDTVRNTRMGILNNLPTCLDEITSMKEEIAKDFAMGSTQMGPRVRADRTGTEQASLTGDERASIIMSTANVSLQGLLSINNSAGAAGAVRVLEMRFEKDLGVHTPVQADAYLRELYENYGWIGENYMRLVVAKVDKVKAAVLKTLDEIATKASMKSHERFWFADIASSLVAGDIAQKMGYFNYDLQYLRDWFIAEQLEEMRDTIDAQRDSTSPLATLMDYLAHINGSIVQTKKVSGKLEPNILSENKHGQILAHHHMESGIIHVLKQDFRTYCNRANRYSVEILKALNAQGIVTDTNSRQELGKGTLFAKGRSWCFTVNLNHPDVAAMLPKVSKADGPPADPQP